MMAPAPTAEAVYIELWTSFASLLQCYSAAHGLHRDIQATVEVSSECIVLRCRNRWLEISHQGSKGTSQREDGSGGTFDLQLDGRVAINDGCNEGFEELDLVAERLAREITQ